MGKSLEVTKGAKILGINLERLHKKELVKSTICLLYI